MSNFPKPPKLKGSLVLLNGFPGTGKLTIARTLQRQLSSSETRLIDNHLTIDAAQAVHPGRGPEHKAFRAGLRHSLLAELKGLPGPETVLIMTLCLGDNEEDLDIYNEHIGIARARDIPCYAFTISCDKSENLSRLQSLARLAGHKTKSTNSAVLESMLSRGVKIHNPTGFDSPFVSKSDQGVNLRHSRIDTTELSSGQSVQRILAVIANTCFRYD